MMIEIDDDCVDFMIVSALRQSYESLKEGPNDGMYSWDNAEENDKEVKKLMKAIKRVHNYYSIPSNRIG
jgi:hypothetical protein